jgi:hypothetical protein
VKIVILSSSSPCPLYNEFWGWYFSYIYPHFKRFEETKKWLNNKILSSMCGTNMTSLCKNILCKLSVIYFHFIKNNRWVVFLHCMSLLYFILKTNWSISFKMVTLLKLWTNLSQLDSEKVSLVSLLYWWQWLIIIILPAKANHFYTGGKG